MSTTIVNKLNLNDSSNRTSIVCWAAKNDDKEWSNETQNWIRVGNMGTGGNNYNCVVRLTFTTGEKGASALSFNFSNAYWIPQLYGGSSTYSGTAGVFKAVITNTSNMYDVSVFGPDETPTISNSVGGCDVTVKASETASNKDIWAQLSGTVRDINLSPNSTYYLWIYGTAKWFCGFALTEYKYSDDEICYLTVTTEDAIYNITYTNGSPASGTKQHGVTYTVQSTAATKTGYTFSAWNTANDGSGTNYTNGSSYTNNAPLTLYPTYTPNKYNVTFNANGGKCTTANKSVTYDSTYGTLPTPTKTGYSFKGWFTEDSGGTQVKSSTKVKITGAQTLYAQWEPDKYVVNLVGNSADFTNTTITVTYGEKYTGLPEEISNLPQWNFEGWYDASEGGARITSNTTVSKTSDHTLYGRWSGTLIFDANGGTCSIQNKTVLYLSSYGTLPSDDDIIRTGYTFSGWYTDASGGVQVNDTTTIVEGMPLTLYAHWTPETYKVELHPNGGTVTPTQIHVTYDSTYGTLPQPSRTNYTFEGWYTAYSGGDNITSKSTVKTASDHSLYARWKTLSTHSNIKIYHGDEWKDYEVYICVNGTFKKCNAHIYKGGTWAST